MYSQNAPRAKHTTRESESLQVISHSTVVEIPIKPRGAGPGATGQYVGHKLINGVVAGIEFAQIILVQNVDVFVFACSDD